MALPVRVSRTEGGDPFDLMRREFDNILGRFAFGREAEREIAPFGVDVREDANHIYVDADLPGFKKDDIDVNIENGMLSIRAEKSEEPAEQKGENYLLRERSYRRFERSFSLPNNVDEQNVQAKLDEGCLRVTLNKTEESKPKKIQVQ